MKKSIISIFLVVVMLVTMIPTFTISSFAETSGTTGDCTWSLDGTVLTIIGDGEMGNLSYNAILPWGTAITEVVIEGGVTLIGDYAFEKCENLQKVIIPDSVRTVGQAAFNNCTNLKYMYYTGTADDWAKISFNSPSSNPMCYTDYEYFNGELVANIVLSEGIININKYAFYDCTNLQSITIPNSVVSVGWGAFSNCENLQKLIIGNGVTSINNYAFSDCIGLQSINIPNSVTFIGEYAFRDCSNLQSITIPDSVTSIEEWAFYNCSSIRSATIGNGVTSINNYVFRGCTSLQYVVISNSVTSIGYQAFNDCVSLWHVLYSGTEKEWEEITIDSYNSHYLKEATRHCKMTGNEVDFSITKEPTCTKKGSMNVKCSFCAAEKNDVAINALGHNYQFAGVVAPTCLEQGYDSYPCNRCDANGKKNFIEVLEHMFEEGKCTHCNGLETDCVSSPHNYPDNYDNTWVITKSDAAKINITFSERTYTETDYDFVYIYDANDNLVGKYSGSQLAGTFITVNSDTVKIRLTSDDQENNYGFSVKKVEAIYSCKHNNAEVRNDIIPFCEEDGYTGDTYCLDCGELVESGRTVSALGHDYSSEYTIDIEPTCYTEGSKSRHCTRCDSKTDITEVLATNHIDKCYCYEYEIVLDTDKTIKITKYLGKEANVEIPAIIDGYTVVAIDDSAFAENSSIISVEIPDTVKTIGKNAFFLCYNLANVALPESLTTIEYSAFSYCTGLINIKIPDSVTGIGEGAFSYCSSLETINIPSKITYIRKNTFRACEKLTRIIVPEKVEIIDEYAFAYCSSLVDVWLPDSVDVICENAFSYSNAFSTVYYAGTELEWNNITIADKKLLNSAQIHYNVSVEEIDSHWQEYSIDATCTVDGEYGYECPCGYKESTGIPALEHEFDEKFTIDKEPTYDETGSKSRHCSRCDEVTDVTEIPMLEALKNGWTLEGDKWAYYENGTKIINKWVKDSVGWCYLGADGYCVTNCWKADSYGWCYLDANGRMVCNNWVLDAGKWYFMDANGYMVSNQWRKDSQGWCYLGSSGAMLTNAWVKDSVGWCYVGADGYCVTNKWVKDSKGWCYLDAQGRMVYNKWVKDSVGWCYVGSSGYMVTNQWVQDGGKWYYLDANGYMVTGTKVINGKTYKFNSSGVWIG